MDMQIEIFDVGHGHCSVITAPTGQKIMVDCGTRSGDRLWWPSTHHNGQDIEMLALMNLDEDHIRDFGDVLKECTVRTVLTNPTIGPAELRALKPEPRGPGAKAVLDWMAAPKGNAAQLQGNAVHDPLTVKWQAFWNGHGGPCKSTNDLSLALFVRYGAFTIFFAGDLEANGWCGMMADPGFRAWAASTSVFVASHHGRENGCHDELFNVMTPQIIVISDDNKEHDTQDTHAYYHWRCHGIPVRGTNRQRHVYTTRSDGSLHIGVNTDSNWTITPGVPVKTYQRQQETNALLSGLGRGLINRAG